MALVMLPSISPEDQLVDEHFYAEGFILTTIVRCSLRMHDERNKEPRGRGSRGEMSRDQQHR
jgi:hypothetical protein